MIRQLSRYDFFCQTFKNHQCVGIYVTIGVLIKGSGSHKRSGLLLASSCVSRTSVVSFLLASSKLLKETAFAIFKHHVLDNFHCHAFAIIAINTFTVVVIFHYIFQQVIIVLPKILLLQLS